MPAANTRDCFTEFIGQKVAGVLFDALPFGRYDLQGGTKTLVFEDGRGLLIHSNGSYGIVSAQDVDRAIKVKQAELKRTKKEIAGVLELAGAR